MRNNRSAVVWIIVVLVVIVWLFLWPKFSNPARADVKKWQEAGIDCLPSHQRASLHIHPKLAITVDGTPEVIPQNTGIVRGCMAELHIHGEDNVIHAESVRAGKEFTLGQFLIVYKKPYAREGFHVSLKVGDAENSEGEALILRDKQELSLTYTAE